NGRRSPGVGRPETTQRRLEDVQLPLRSHEGWQLEPVAHARLGHDQAGVRRLHLDLAPKVRDVDTEILLRVAEAAPPHSLVDLLVRERATRLCRKSTKNAPLGRRQVRGLSTG